MPPNIDQVQDDLRGLIEGDVLFGDLARTMYASDASVFQHPPWGVVRPRDVADVAALMEYAAEHELPLIPRGAGTSLAGGPLGPGLVVDTTRWMRRMIAQDETTVRVQAGAPLGLLDEQLALTGRHFPVDPFNAAVRSVGGVLATNSAGSGWLRFGAARRHVRRIQMVLVGGEVLELARDEAADRVPTVERLQREVGEILASSPARPTAAKAIIDHAGFQAPRLPSGAVDLVGLTVGSEGTLGMITEATLDTPSLPAAEGIALVMCERLESAARAAQTISHSGATACDLYDRRLLTMARDVDRRYMQLVPAGTEALLAVRWHGPALNEVRQRVRQVVDQVVRVEKLAFEAKTMLEPREVRHFSRVIAAAPLWLYRTRGASRPIPLIDDVAVAPQELPEFLTEAQNILKRRQFTAAVYAHAGHGVVRLRPLVDLGNPSEVDRLPGLAAELYAAVLARGGSLAGVASPGIARGGFLRSQLGDWLDTMRRIRGAFDPRGLLHPGLAAAWDETPGASDGWLARLRPGRRVLPTAGEIEAATDEEIAAAEPSYAPEDETGAPQLVTLQLAWNGDEAAQTAAACHGCGRCRSQEADVRMCPLFRFAPREEASPRAKANLMRAIFTGRLEPDYLHTEGFRAIADLCIHCHQCRLECPEQVDIPRLMAEAKAQYAAVNGVRSHDFLPYRLDTLAAWGSSLSTIANWALGTRFTRWLLERVLGLARGRKLPRFAGRPFLQIAEESKLTRVRRQGERRVAYFLDIYANWFDTELAQAVVQVLRHNGVNVHVPPGQRRSGVSLVAIGALDAAREVARHNVRALADTVRRGYTIVASEPSAALCLRHEYPQLLDNDEVRLVAENTRDVGEYLWEMHQLGELELDFQPINATVGYHLPCHLRAQTDASPGERLLQLIPGMTVHRVERGCSGMAGSYGLRYENYRNSLRAGWGLISAMRESALQAGATECSSCKMQMEQGATKTTLHPLKLLALSYGLMPELDDLLTRQSEELLVS